MTINKKIYQIRCSRGISLAELAYKTGYSIDDIINIEKDGTIITGFTLLLILEAFGMTINEFSNG